MKKTDTATVGDNELMGPVVTDIGAAVLMTGEFAAMVGAMEEGTLLPDTVTVGDNEPMVTMGADEVIPGTGDVVIGTLGR